MKLSKEALIKQNAELAANNSRLCREDQRMRFEFTKLLNDYRPSSYDFSHRTPEAMTWEAIFFGMGELRADANYSCLIQGREEMRDQIKSLTAQLSEVKK